MTTATVPGIDRFFAGGRHVRLLIAGQTPAGLALPDCTHFERVARLAWQGQPGPVIADPARLPFTEALFDRALATSALPKPAVRAELREIWRVLAPAGLALFVVKARRPWQLQAPGWGKRRLELLLADALFEVLDWRTEAIPDRHHLILVGKRDGLRPAMIGRAAESPIAATA